MKDQVDYKIQADSAPVESLVRARVSHKELERLFDEYLSTLQEDDEEELYCSSKDFAEVGARPFLKWLRKRLAA